MSLSLSLSSATLHDHGIIITNDSSKVIDKNKVRREREKAINDLVEKSRASTEPIRSIYFDGRKEDTLVQVQKWSIKCTSTIKQEHYVILEEPNSKYLGHVSPQSGSPQDIYDSILELLESKLCDILAIGCDGTPINTGLKNGVLAKLEQHYGFNIQWLANELALRHLISV